MAYEDQPVLVPTEFGIGRCSVQSSPWRQQATAAAGAGGVAACESDTVAHHRGAVLVAVPDPLGLSRRLHLKHTHAEGRLPATPRHGISAVLAVQ